MTRRDFTHPFERQHLLVRTWPFLLAMVLAWLTVPFAPDLRAPLLIAAAAMLNVLIVLAVYVLPWERISYGAVLPALAWLVVVALLRHGTAGSASGFAALVLLTVLWSALYGTRVELAAAVTGAVLAIAIPALVASPELYPDAELRRAFLIGVVGALTGTAVHETVAGLFAERAGRERAEAQLTRARAFELNDDVVQDLAVAKLSLEVGRTADGIAALERALDSGKRIISDMVEESGRFERRAPTGDESEQ